MKQLIFGLFVMVALFGAFDTPHALAACAYPGYLNSNGQCMNMYQNTYTYHYQTRPTYNYQQQQHLVAYIAQLEALLQQLRDLQDQTYTPYNPYSGIAGGTSAVDVTTRSATDIEDDRARLRGEVDFNREDEATVYFQWGESSSRLDEETIPVVLDEDDDDEEFYQIISDLDEDEVYYFRAVAEDERGRRDFGNILSFRTDDDNRSSNDDDEPEVETGDADDITEDSAEIEGEIDMNDFRNGTAFFVYGEDEDQIDDVARDYDEYRDVDEDGDDLQKVLVDNDVDGRADVWAEIYGLDDDTDIFYALCVEYEDEDDDEVLECGDTEEFTTDD